MPSPAHPWGSDNNVHVHNHATTDRMAGKAFGLEGESINVTSAYAAEPGSDVDFLMQKLRAVHGFASWASEHYSPEDPLVVSKVELLDYVSQGKECSKALLALSSGGGGGGDDDDDDEEALETRRELLMMSGDVYVPQIPRPCFRFVGGNLTMPSTA